MNSIKTFAEIEPIIIASGKQMLQYCGSDFNLNDPERRKVYEDVYNYFMRLDKKYSGTKGLMIIGSVGTGKTIMMKIFHKLIRDVDGAPLISDFVDSNSIIREFLIKDGGFDVIEKYSRRHYFSQRMNYKPKGLCIDDLGMEDQKVKSYGNEANVIADILFSRYNEMIDSGMRTFATSNVPPAKLGDLYGTRIADRMIEMFNVITLTGKSLRA